MMECILNSVVYVKYVYILKGQNSNWLYLNACGLWELKIHFGESFYLRAQLARSPFPDHTHFLAEYITRRGTTDAWELVLHHTYIAKVGPQQADELWLWETMSIRGL